MIGSAAGVIGKDCPITLIRPGDLVRASLLIAQRVQFRSLLSLLNEIQLSRAVDSIALRIRPDHVPAIGFIARVKCGSGVLDRLRVQALNPSSAGTERHLAPF